MAKITVLAKACNSCLRIKAVDEFREITGFGYSLICRDCECNANNAEKIKTPKSFTPRKGRRQGVNRSAKNASETT